MFRARRGDRRAASSTAPVLGRGWVLPRWLEQQTDPDHAGYTVGTTPPRNVTGRNWTLIGSLDSDRRAAVDPAGLVWPAGASWSLDWWVGAGDRWLVPSRQATVRQRLLGATPVVETVLRLPGGEVTHRAYGVRLPGEAVVIELANDAPEPISIALAIRPYDLLGPGAVDRVAVDSRQVTVEDRPALLLPRDPGLVLTGTGDAFTALANAEPAGAAEVSCPDGMAQVTVVMPLVHTGRLHVIVPLDHPDRRRSRRRSAPVATLDETSFGRVPAAAVVADGWTAQTERSPTVRFPDPRLAEAVEAVRRSLVLHETGDAVVVDPMTGDDDAGGPAAGNSVLAGAVTGDGPVVEVAPLLGAMMRWGRAEEAARVLAVLAQRHDEREATADGRVAWADAGALLGALGEHWRLTRDRALIAAVAEPVIRAVAQIDRARLVERGAATGLIARRPDHDRPPRALDAVRAHRGLRDAATILRAIDETAAAAEAERIEAEFRTDLVASLEAAAAAHGGPAPSSPQRPLDETAVEVLAAACSGDVIAADHPIVVAAAEAVRTRFLHGAAVHDSAPPRGLNVATTLRLATAELAVGDLRAIDRLRWVLGAATPTWTWPASIHPRSGGGTNGAGQCGASAATLLSFARRLLVMERPEPDGLRLQVASVVAPDWYGVDWEATGLPTHAGSLGLAVRWHGQRPALLWELDPHPDAPAWRLTAPGFDPTFQTSAPAGETLLAAPPLADELAADGSTSGPG